MRKPLHDLLSTLLVNLANLFKVKTIITSGIVFTFCFKTLRGLDITSEFVMVATSVVTYYFTKDIIHSDKSGIISDRKDVEEWEEKK